MVSFILPSDHRHSTNTSPRKDLMGECDQETTEEILDYFYESGGNFIDTANSYQVSSASITWFLKVLTIK